MFVWARTHALVKISGAVSSMVLSSAGRTLAAGRLGLAGLATVSALRCRTAFGLDFCENSVSVMAA